MGSELVDTFLAALSDDAPRSEYAACSELPGLLRDWLVIARRAWPSIDVSSESFIAYVAQRVDPQASPSTLSDLRISDLYLAFGSVQGLPSALSYLERAYFRRLDAVVARIAPNEVDEVISQLRQSLLIPSRTPGGLAGYAGRAELWTWLRVCAIRSAIKIHRRAERGSSVEQSGLEAVCVPDATGASPDTDHERRRFAAEARRALEASFGELAPRDKNLLMQHYLDGLTTEQLGRLHGLHRVSISRRLARARRLLIRRTRAHLVRRLSLTSSECESVLRALRSHLDITLQRVLAPSPNPSPSPT